MIIEDGVITYPDRRLDRLPGLLGHRRYHDQAARPLRERPANPANAGAATASDLLGRRHEVLTNRLLTDLGRLGLRLPVRAQRHARLALGAQLDAQDLVQLDHVALESEP